MSSPSATSHLPLSKSTIKASTSSSSNTSETPSLFTNPLNESEELSKLFSNTSSSFKAMIRDEIYTLNVMEQKQREAGRVLLKAVHERDIKGVETALEADAYWNVLDEQSSLNSLKLATKSDLADIVEVLINSKTFKNLPDFFRTTELIGAAIIAASKKHKKTFKIIIQHMTIEQIPDIISHFYFSQMPHWLEYTKFTIETVIEHMTIEQIEETIEKFRNVQMKLLEDNEIEIIHRECTIVANNAIDIIKNTQALANFRMNTYDLINTQRGVPHSQENEVRQEG